MKGFKIKGVRFESDPLCVDSIGRPSQYVSEDGRIIVYKIDTRNPKPWRVGIDGVTLLRPKRDGPRIFMIASKAAIAAITQLKKRGEQR